MKFFRLFSVLAVMILAACGTEAGAIAEADLPETIEVSNTTLLLNGQGARTKYLVKLYVAGLYLQEKSSDATKVIDDDATMVIRLHITSDKLTVEKMKDALREGFVNATGGDTAAIQDDIDTFIGAFNEENKIGDVSDLIYTPAKGVEVVRNGKSSVIIPGLPFKKAVFGIWLSDNPAQDSLRDEMLGIE